MPSIRIKSIKPKSMDVKGYRTIITKQLRTEGTKIEKELLKPTKTWKERVPFKKTLRTEKASAVMRVATSEKRYVLLTLGTRKRWAVMSSDFRSKTKVRSLSARQGRGSTVIRGQRAMSQRNIAPRPGIKARHFTDEVVKVRSAIFFRNMRRAMNKAAKGTF